MHKDRDVATEHAEWLRQESELALAATQACRLVGETFDLLASGPPERAAQERALFYRALVLAGRSIEDWLAHMGETRV